MIQNQLLSKYITSQCSKLSPYLHNGKLVIMFFNLSGTGRFPREIRVLPLCRHLCMKCATAVICEIIIFMWVVHQRGSSARMNLMFWGVCVGCESPHRCGHSLYFDTVLQILWLASLSKIMFHQKNLIWTSNMPATFVLTKKFSKKDLVCISIIYPINH